METLISTFHIELPLLIAQGVNFLAVFLVLWFFALKPLMKTMKERTHTIEKSLEDAKQIESNLAKSQQEYESKLAEGRAEAGRIREQAGEEAQNKKQAMIDEAKEEIEKLVNGAKIQIQDEKQNTIHAINKQIASLIELSLEKILHQKIDASADKKLIDEAIKEIALREK